MTEEMEIDLKDLLYKILKSWRMIVVYCIIFAVVADIASMGLTFINIRKNKNELSKQASELLELRDELTEREIAEVQEVYDNYVKIRNTNESIEDYNDNSILMRIEANKVPTMKLRYNIDTHYKIEYPVISEKDYTDEIMSEYCSILNSDDVIAEIAKAYGDDIKVEYIREVVSIEKVSGTIFEVTIFAPEKQQCEQMSEAVKNVINEEKSEIGNKYGKYDFALVDETYTEELRTDILETQQTRYAKSDTIRERLSTLGGKLNPNQKSYYTALINYEIAKEQKAIVASKKRELLETDSSKAIEEKTYTSEIAEENDLSKAEDLITAEVVYEDAKISFISIKFIIIGFVLGGIIACGVICCGYLFVPVLRTADTMNSAFSVSVIENIWIKDDKKKALSFVDDFIDNLFYAKAFKVSADDKVVLASEIIKIASDKAGYKKLHITGASEKAADIAEKISKGIAGVTVTTGALISEDIKSLREMADSDAVVLVEAAEQSRIDDIVKEIELIKGSKAEIIGSVVVNRY